MTQHWVERTRWCTNMAGPWFPYKPSKAPQTLAQEELAGQSSLRVLGNQGQSPVQLQLYTSHTVHTGQGPPCPEVPPAIIVSELRAAFKVESRHTWFTLLFLHLHTPTSQGLTRPSDRSRDRLCPDTWGHGCHSEEIKSKLPSFMRGVRKRELG